MEKWKKYYKSRYVDLYFGLWYMHKRGGVIFVQIFYVVDGAHWLFKKKKKRGGRRRGRTREQGERREPNPLIFTTSFRYLSTCGGRPNHDRSPSHLSIYINPYLQKKIGREREGKPKEEAGHLIGKQLPM